MAWCLIKHRDNFTFTFTLHELYDLLSSHARKLLTELQHLHVYNPDCSETVTASNTTVFSLARTTLTWFITHKIVRNIAVDIRLLFDLGREEEQRLICRDVTQDEGSFC
jgi:hypothetical protein